MIFITAIISLGIGLALGGFFWGHYADEVAAQAQEIDALNLNNLRLRGQCAQLATMAYEAQDEAEHLAWAKEVIANLSDGK